MGTLDTYRILGNASLSFNWLLCLLIVADDAVCRVYALDVIILRRHVGMRCCRKLIGCFNFARERARELGLNEGAYIPFSDPTNPKRVTVAVKCRSDLVKSCTHPSGSVRTSSQSPMPNNPNLVAGFH